MTKPLSEQVAELQELFDRVALECDQRGETIAELQEEREYYRHRATAADEKVIILGAANKRLVADNTTLKTERDQLKANAVSDLIKRHWLENVAHNREAERDDLRRQAQEANEEHRKFTSALGFGDGVTEPSATYEQMLEPIQQAMQESLDHHECPMICELCGEWLADTPCEHCHGSGADNAASQAAMAYSECEWCAGVGRIHPGCVEKSYADLVEEVEGLKGEAAELGPATAPTVPRFITADELREGQTVATFYDDGSGSLGVVEGVDFQGNTILSSGNVVPRYSAMEDRSVVLLADAPQPTGYADDDHQDAEVLQWHQPTPRLTVHDLEVAPVGSVLSFGHLERTKGPYGLWIADTGATFSNKGMIERGFEDATLTTPEAQ